MPPCSRLFGFFTSQKDNCCVADSPGRFFLRFFAEHFRNVQELPPTDDSMENLVVQDSSMTFFHVDLIFISYKRYLSLLSISFSDHCYTSSTRETKILEILDARVSQIDQCGMQSRFAGHALDRFISNRYRVRAGNA